jgi:hypothetical protein
LRARVVRGHGVIIGGWRMEWKRGTGMGVASAAGWA